MTCMGASQFLSPGLSCIWSTQARRASCRKFFACPICMMGLEGAEVEIKVLRNTGAGNIVDQYIRFCEISDEQRKQYGYTMKAVEETLRICCDENILMPFLASRQKEVQDIMVTLFNQERITEIHEYNLMKEARQQGQQEGLEKGIRAMVLTLKEFTADRAAVAQKLVKQFELLPQTAEEKVAQYWES
mgnify:FL=1